MAVDRLRVEQNERVDLGDFRFQSDEGLNLLAEQTPGKLLTDPNGLRAWILDGFTIDNPSGNQVRVTKGRAILSRREGGVITHGVVVTEGDATKIIDTTSFTAVVHSIFVRFEYVDGATLSRVFWDASTASEFSQNVATRRKANWSMRIEQTNPGAEWLKIGEVDLSVGPSSITDQRPLYFEGVVSDAFANTWGSGTDRSADRAVNGIKDLQEFTAMVRTNFEQLRPVGARWWDERGLEVTGVTTDEPGIIGRGGAANGIGVLGTGSGTEPGVRGEGGVTDGDGLDGAGMGTGSGVLGTGGGVDGDGVRGAGGAANGVGVRGFGNGAGAGVHGTNTGGTGHGVLAQANPTAPVRSSLRVVPQDADPTTPSIGDVYIRSLSGKARIFNGSVWDRLVNQTAVSIVDSDLTGSVNTEQDFSPVVTLPADSLKVGSTIRVRTFGSIIALTSSINVTIRLRIGAALVVTRSQALPALNDIFYIDGIYTIRSEGPAAALRGEASVVLDASTVSPDIEFKTVASIDTETPSDVKVTAQWSVVDAGNIFRLQQLVVDVL